MKTKIFNLIILDESGSMDCVRKQTISGCDETLNTIRSTQEKFAETKEHFVSIFAFQSDGKMPSRYIIKNEPVESVKNITAEDYSPWGGTPLYGVAQPEHRQRHGFHARRRGHGADVIKERNSRIAYYSRLEEADTEMNNRMAEQPDLSEEELERLRKERLNRRKNANLGYFNV